MPIKLKMVRLSTACKDLPTSLNGMITHALIGMDKQVRYLFQPRGLNPENGQPVEKIFVGAERLKISDSDMEEVEIPFEILGTEISDKASGFKGTAIEFVRYINGCFHVVIQPKGALKSTNSPAGRCEFDLRQCEGPMIKKLSKAQLEESKKKNPSPTGDRITVPVPRTTSGAIKHQH